MVLRFLSSLFLLSLFVFSPAQAQNQSGAAQERVLVAGRDYVVLAKKIPSSVERLDVVYFFWYNSPTTAKMDPAIRRWASSQAPALVKFIPQPAILSQEWGLGARLFFALRDLNVEDKVGPRLVQALEENVVDYNNPKALYAWLKEEGVNPKQLMEALNSPSTIAQTTWMASSMQLYGVQQVPTVIIDGQFVFTPKANETASAFVDRLNYASVVLAKRKIKSPAKTPSK